MNINEIAHASWNCKYHVVFVPKKSILREMPGNRSDIKEIVPMERNNDGGGRGMRRSCIRGVAKRFLGTYGSLKISPPR